MSVIDQANLLRRLKERGYQFDCIYDVGANIGSWTCEARKVFPDARYELFEPLAGRHPELDRASRYSEISNYGLHSVALSDHNGIERIKVLGDRGVGSSILILDSDFRKQTSFVEVPLFTMDDYVARLGLAWPDFIKLDTQASERKILSGARQCLAHAKFVLVETWMRRVYGPETPLFHELAAFLYQFDYVLYDMLSLNEGRDPDGTLRWFDAVFIHKPHSKFDSSFL